MIQRNAAISEFPDYRADLGANKRNLVVQLGRRRGSVAFVWLAAAAFVFLALLPAFGLPLTVWLGAVALPPALAATRTVLAYPETTARLIPAQAQTLLAFLLLALGSGIGLVLAP